MIKIIMILATLSNACNISYHSTIEPMNEFLNTIVTMHLGESFSADSRVLLEPFPIGFNECITTKNVSSKLNAIMKPRGMYVFWSSGVLVINNLADPELYKSKYDYYSFDLPPYTKDFPPLKDFDISLDTLNNKLILYGTRKQNKFIDTYFKNLKKPNTYKIQLNISEILIDTSTNKGFDVNGFIQNSQQNWLNTNLKTPFVFSYNSDSTIVNQNILQNPTIDLIPNKEITFFTGQKIERTKATSNEMQLVNETYFLDVGLDIKILLHEYQNNIYIDIRINNEDFFGENNLSSTSLNSNIEIIPDTWRNLVGDTRTTSRLVKSGNPIFTWIPYIGKYFGKTSKKSLKQILIYSIKVKKNENR